MKFIRDMKTNYKILLSFSLSFSIFFIIISLLMGRIIGNRFIDFQIKSSEVIVENTRNMLSLAVETSIKNYLRGIAEKNLDIITDYHKLVLQRKITKDEAISEIRKIFLSQKIGETGYVAGVSSRGILSIHPFSEGADASRHEFMQRAIAMKNGYLEYNWKNPGDTNERQKVGYMAYFEPWDIIVWVSSYKSEFVSLIRPEQFENEINDIRIGESGYVFVMDNQGNAIIHPELKGANFFELQNNENSVEFLREVIQKQNGTIEYKWKSENDNRFRDKIMYFNYLEDLDWVVCGGTYIDELRAESRAVIKIMLIFLPVGLLVFIIISYLISRGVTKPIKKTVERIRFIVTENDLTQELPVYSNDEIGMLTKSFNTFLSGISLVLMNVNKSVVKIIELVQALFSSVQEAASTANQQAAAVKEIVSTMEDADTLAKSIGNKITEVTVTAEHSRNIVNTGFDKVTESLSKMEEINESNRTTIEGIMYLNEKINNIWDIVNMINGIADQTKIIAFNAELEAAAAGDAGKNFRIVATEIRRLADNTVDSTSDIKEKITEIQKSSDRLLLTSENGTEKIKEGNKLTHEINSMFKEILTSAEASSDSTKVISVSIKQQISSFEQILIALKQISEGVDYTAVATNETNRVAENLQELVDLLSGILGKYKIISDENGSN